MCWVKHVKLLFALYTALSLLIKYSARALPFQVKRYNSRPHATALITKSIVTLQSLEFRHL